MKKVKEVCFFKWQNAYCMIDIGEQLRDNDSNMSTSQKKMGIDKGAEYEKVLEHYKSRDGQLLLDYLDLEHLYFKNHKIENVRFAKLKSNRIRDITPLLEFDTLEEIDISRNEISKLLIRKKYPKLRILNMAENYLD